MKKLSVLLLMFCVFAAANAQNFLEKNPIGEYRISQGDDWKKTDITYAPEVEKYAEYFSVAIAVPDSVVVVYRMEKIIKMTGLFRAQQLVYEQSIIFDSKSNEILPIESAKEEEKDSLLLIFGMISVLFMVISNLIKKDSALTKKGTAAVGFGFGIIAAILALFATAATALVGLHDFLAVTGATVAGFGAYCVDTRKLYIIFNILYYVFIAAYFCLMFV